MKRIKFIFIAMLAMAITAPVMAYAATPKKAAKKVSTMGKRGAVSGVAVTNAKPIDMGLPSGTLWADRNVGAESTEAYGGLYRYGNKGKMGGQGCPKENIVGTKLDVATLKMGKNWRMPTAAELTELWENCTHEFDVVNNQLGFRLRGPNGNCLFLPLTGMMYNYGRSSAGDFAFYQSGEITDSRMYQVGFEVVTLNLWQKDDDTYKCEMGSESPGSGCPIRAVYIGK